LTAIETLSKKIADRSAAIGVIGLGYVGLPVAALFAQAGFRVIGVDTKQERIAVINAGNSPIEGDEPGLPALLADVVSAGGFHATADYEALRKAEIVLISVETPVNEDHIPAYKAMKGALRSLGAVMQAGTLVVVESTVMPGTMAHIAKTLLEETSGMTCGKDFYLGNCPERVMPGKLLRNLRTMNRVAGGDSPQIARMVRDLYNSFVEAEIDTTDWITAEIVKTAENAYRDVQIAFANEVALICEGLGADVWRVRELVRKSPGREMLQPGAGVGGHCIPKDPWLLASSVKDLDVPIRLIPTAREINAGMPRHMMNLLKKVLHDLRGKKILLLGYAYLQNSDDTRNSPSAALAESLAAEGAEVAVHDPFVAEYRGDVYEAARGCDAAVLVTAHDAYGEIDLKKFGSILKDAIILDGRNLFDSAQARAADVGLVRLGNPIR